MLNERVGPGAGVAVLWVLGKYNNNSFKYNFESISSWSQIEKQKRERKKLNFINILDIIYSLNETC